MNRVIAIFLLFAVLMSAQEADGDKFVTVPKKYVSAEGLTHQGSPSTFAQYQGIGKEIGDATREGLTAVVDVSEKFGATGVGRFVMFMIAWKVLGDRLLGIILGIPLWLIGLRIWWLVLQALLFGRKRWNKETRTYTKEDPYKFDSGDAKGMIGTALFVVPLVWTIPLMIIILH